MKYNRFFIKYGLVTIVIVMLTLLTIEYSDRSKLTWTQGLTPIESVSTDKKVVAIALNVYEGNDEIKEILRILDKRHIKISFFIGGIWAKNNPDVLSILKEKGQDIQNHGYYHKNPSTLNDRENINEVKRTEDLIYSICGIRTNLFEPPSGDYDENTIKIMNSINYKVVTWNIDTIDWRNDATKTLIKNRIRKKLNKGSIILMHPKKVTAQSMEEIIDYIYSQGYEVISVNELINYN